MLKVERISRGKEISIAFRRKESIFNPTFMNAFIWAAAFHIGALVIFHIAPFSLSSGRVFSPAVVESDLFDGKAVAALDQEGPPKRYLLEPKESQPRLPKIPRVTLKEYFEPIQTAPANAYLFESIEQELWSEKFFKPHGETAFFPCEIQLAGELSQASFSINDQMPHVLEVFKATYKIQVENRTGKVFWFERVEAPESMRPMIENMLKSIQFDLDSKGFITTGEIEITCNQRRVYD